MSANSSKDAHWKCCSYTRDTEILMTAANTTTLMG